MQPGKLRSLDRLAGPGGRFEILAIDQRPPVFELIRTAGSDDLAAGALAIRRAVVRALQPVSTATLIDPNSALQLLPELDPGPGLLLTLEDHDFEVEGDERMSSMIADWSVDRIKRSGGEAVKFLAWYRPDASERVRQHQQDLVASVGAACRAHEIPLVFELLSYPLLGRDVAAADKVEIIRRSIADFTDPEFGVDLFKIESPNGRVAPGQEHLLLDEAALDEAFRVLDAEMNRPWVLLSGGCDRPQFVRSLRAACRAGASGYLAGRSIWWEAVSHFPNLDAVDEGLRTDAIPFMRELHDLVAELAPSWRERSRALGPPAVSGDDARLADRPLQPMGARS